MREDLARNINMIWRWFRYPTDFKTLEDRFWGPANLISYFIGGLTWSNGEQILYVGKMWQSNSANAWKRNNWMYREDKANGWTIPTKLQRFLAYFDFRHD